MIVLRQRRLEGFDGGVVFLLGDVDAPQLVMRVRVAAAAQLDGGFELGSGVWDVAETVERQAEVVMSARELRVLFECLAERLDRFGEVALAAQGDAELVVSPREMVALADGCAVSGDGFL